jgi:hypothetical protein
VASRSRAGQLDQSATIAAPRGAKARSRPLFLRRVAGSGARSSESDGEGYTAWRARRSRRAQTVLALSFAQAPAARVVSTCYKSRLWSFDA